MSDSIKRINAIARKELVEFVRDWRTILAIILIPLLLFPALFIVMPVILESEAAELREMSVDVLVQGDLPSDLSENLSAEGVVISYGSLPDDIANLSDAGGDSQLLRDGEYDSILRLSDSDSGWMFSIIYMSTSEASRESRARVLQVMNAWESNVVNATLVDAGLDPESTLNPVRWDGDVQFSDAATKGEQAGLTLSLFIPLVLAMWTATSAIQPSIDMTAGERERGTLEALLTLPASRMEILMGKWLAVATITGVGVALQIAGLLFAITYLASANVIGVPEMSLIAFLLLAACVLLFAIMVVAFELALAMRSHSVKEAGSILGPSILLILFPALFTQIINLDGVESFWFAIPVVNMLLAMRELMLDRVVVEHVLIWIVSSLLYAILAARYAAKQFSREDLVASIS